ncbi:hypothetical protein Asd1617_04223 [Shigella dysenteriae 1617]|uniref:Uncharacterized protein n=1 Tax=Shigella dysenteriae 1617 TaxID=754093 RepID=A0A0A6ZYP8_SHIDY|nr:hypothetical protein Asd1617_04223 [Shigella dysenteriae 1617]
MRVFAPTVSFLRGFVASKKMHSDVVFCRLRFVYFVM